VNAGSRSADADLVAVPQDGERGAEVTEQVPELPPEGHVARVAGRLGHQRPFAPETRARGKPRRPVRAGREIDGAGHATIQTARAVVRRVVRAARLALGWLPMLVHGPIPYKYQILGIGRPDRRVGLVHGAAPDRARGRRDRLAVALVRARPALAACSCCSRLSLVSLATPGCQSACMFWNDVTRPRSVSPWRAWPSS